MTFDRDRLPDPVNYYEGQGLILKGPRSTKWKTTRCELHGGGDSMRVNVATGAFRCMNCGARGGDVLAYHMAESGLEFVEAAKALGAWIEDGKPRKPQNPQHCLHALRWRCSVSRRRWRQWLLATWPRG